MMLTQPIVQSPSKSKPSTCVRIVHEVLQDYAQRGVFVGFGAQAFTAGAGHFRMMWHAGRAFDVIVKPSQSTLVMPIVLPGVPTRSSMYRSYRNFVKSFVDESRPMHRRIDATRATVVASNRKGDVALTMTITGDNYGYGAQKLINLANETFIVFLHDGPYQDYQAEVLGHLHELP